MLRLSHSSTLLAVAVAGAIAYDSNHIAAPELLPHIADVSHASIEAVRFFYNFYTLKSSDSPEIVTCYNTNQTEYYDSTLGLTAGAN